MTTRPSTASPRNSSRSFDWPPACSAHHDRCARRGSSSSGSANGVAEPLGRARQRLGRIGSQRRRRSTRADDVVDGVAHGLQVLEVLVLDAEPDGALAELLLEGLDQLDQGQGVGVEVVGERVALGDRGRLDLEDVGQAVTDELEDLLAAHRALLDVGLGRHGATPGGGIGTRRAVAVSELVRL